MGRGYADGYIYKHSMYLTKISTYKLILNINDYFNLILIKSNLLQ